MTSKVYFSPFQATFNSNGLPVARAMLYFFYTETEDLAPIYADADMTTPLANPVIADNAARYPNIYLDSNILYRVRETGPTGIPLTDDIDPYTPGQAAIVVPDLDTFTDPSGSSNVGFIQAGVGATATTLQTETRLRGLRPEQFGAVGDGVADDSAALMRAWVQQQATGIPAIGTPGARYGIGVNAWAGLSLNLVRDFEFYGNGAEIVSLFPATQSAIAGAVNPSIKIDGDPGNTGTYFECKIHGLNADLNEIKEPLFAPYRCRLNMVGNKMRNGDILTGIGDASIWLYVLKCTGIVCNNYARFCPYPVYAGHTDAGMHCTDLIVTHNDFQECYQEGDDSVRGDPLNGVLHGGIVAFNTFRFHYGLALSAVAASPSTSKMILIIGNIISDFTASGIQTDVVGATTCDNWIIALNQIDNAIGAAAPIYLLRLSRALVFGNRGENSSTAMVVDLSSNVRIQSNSFKKGTGGAGQGLNLLCQIGNTSEIDVLDNTFEDFTTGIYCSGGGGTLSNSRIRGNRIVGGAEGLRFDDTCVNVEVDSNSVTGTVGLSINNLTTNGITGVRFSRNNTQSTNGVYFTAAYNPPSLAINAAGAIQTLAVPGAALGDAVTFVSASIDTAGVVFPAWISAADTLSYFAFNSGGANPTDLAALNLYFQVTKKGG